MRTTGQLPNKLLRKLENYTSRHPILFGFSLIVLFTILSTLTWPITQLGVDPAGKDVSESFAKLMIAACFLLLLFGFGWGKAAGFLSAGAKPIWGLMLGLLVYKAFFSVYAFTGSFKMNLPPLNRALAILLFAFATSLLEESMYRGLLLTAMVKAWGSTRRGLLKAVMLSGLFWASLHFFNLIGNPFPVVALQVLSVTLSGFFYAATILFSGSIWPAIVFHMVVNASVTLQVVQNPSFEETTTAWLIYFLVSLPLVAAGFYLLRKGEINLRKSKESQQFESVSESQGI